MNRIDRTEQKMQEIFRTSAVVNMGNDPEFMKILQRFIFGDVCYTGSLDTHIRELVTVTVLTTLNTLPQLKSHIQGSLNVGCTPIEIRETIYQCAPFIGFPRTLNAIGIMNEVFIENGIVLPLEEQGTVSDEDRYEKGLELQKPIYGDEIEERYSYLPDDFSGAIPRFLTELCFGDFATRKGLDKKLRELFIVVILATMGGAEFQLKSHIYGALKVGNTKEEIVCALVHASGYMGIPRLFNALNTAKDLLN